MSSLSDIPCYFPSICIPTAFRTVTDKMVRDTFRKLDLGTIERIEIFPTFDSKGRKFNRIIAHFDSWDDTIAANNVRQKLLSGKEVKIVYDDPIHWRIYAASTQEQHSNPTTLAEVDEFGRELVRKCALVRAENKQARDAFISMLENLEEGEVISDYASPYSELLETLQGCTCYKCSRYR